MIKLTDASLLALANLRSRTVRTILTVFLASLLFGVLVAASLMMTGVFTSVDNFRKDGLTSRYIVGIYPNSGTDTLPKLRRDPQLIAEAKKRYINLIERKKVEAERLGLSYNQASDQPPYTQAADGKGEMLALHDSNSIVFDVLHDYFKDKPTVDDVKLREVARRYHAIDFFASTYRHIPRASTLEALPDGKEIFYDDTDSGTQRVRSFIDPTLMVIAPPEITRSFMLPDDAGWQPDGTSLPIILPQNTIERMLDKEAPADHSSASHKLAYLKQLRQAASALTFQACYRNSASVARIQKTIEQQKFIKANEGKDDYQKPPVIYQLPDPTKCDDPSVVNDTRSESEKQLDENQAIFDEKFSSMVDPESYFVTFKVVGISPAEATFNPNRPDEKATSFSDVVDGLLMTSGIGQAMPQSLYEKLDDTEKQKYAELFTFTPTYFIGNEDDKLRYVEFSSAKDAQTFIDEQGCITQVDGVCKPIERDYQLFLAFTNSVALDDIQDKAYAWFRYAMFAVVILAVVIMWTAIGRAIADGRHETAIFRAIGFKRGDIAAIYIVYTMILSVLVAVCSIGIGWFGAFLVDQQLAQSLTMKAQYGFGGLDMAKEVSLIGFNPWQILCIMIACLATGLISMVIPLLANVRRNPIRDMREE